MHVSNLLFEKKYQSFIDQVRRFFLKSSNYVHSGTNASKSDKSNEPMRGRINYDKL